MVSVTDKQGKMDTRNVPYPCVCINAHLTDNQRCSGLCEGYKDFIGRVYYGGEVWARPRVKRIENLAKKLSECSGLGDWEGE